MRSASIYAWGESNGRVTYVPLFSIPFLSFEVNVLGGIIDRDAVKNNLAVLQVAANSLGLRVGIHTCTVHVRALYDLMQIPCPRTFG